MPVCAVPTCATTHRMTDKALYKFPRDANYARIWVRCCMKKDSFNTKGAYICSLHFADEAYQRDINHDVLGYSSRKNLRKDAVPTLQIPSLRMFRKSIVETNESEDVSLLVDVIPALSPKNFLKNIQFDFISCFRLNKNRKKFHHSYMRCRANSMLPTHSTESPVDLTDKESDRNVENISGKKTLLSELESSNHEETVNLV